MRDATGHPGSSNVDSRAQAERAIELAVAAPRRAKALAEVALAGAHATKDAEAQSLAERALGLSALEQKDGETAVRQLRRAVRTAEKAQLVVRAAEARMSLGRALLYTGNSTGAFRELDLAGSALEGLPAARLQLQRAILLHHHYRLDEALVGYRASLTVFRRAGDRLWEARALNNRGLVYGYRGALGAAERDLLAAARLYSELSLDLALAEVEHNLGWVAGRRGDIPAALRYFDRAHERRVARGVPLAERPNELSDRCELLLSVRLVAEARTAAEQAVSELQKGKMAVETAEARLMLAEAALLEGDCETARLEAETAARSFARQRRARWAALARYTALRASFLEHGPSASRLRAAQRAADSLGEAGWTVAALDARLLSARIALALGQTRAARNALARVRVSRRDPVDLRVRAKHAAALVAIADGHRREAYTALRAGARLVHDFRAVLGATELRAQVSGQAEELAQSGLRFALEDADPRRALGWSEEWRAAALRLRPVRPPDNAELAAELAELRGASAELHEAVLGGRDPRKLQARQATLEKSIRDRTRRTPGITVETAGPRSFSELEALLGDGALVAYFEVDGTLHAVTLADRQARLHELGRAAEVRAELDALRFGLRRLAQATTSSASRLAAQGATDHAVARLDELVVQPLARPIGERPLVIVPTGTLHAMPWSIISSLAGRPVTVAPSASAWADARERRLAVGAERPRVLVAAGPGLPFAEAEAHAVALLHRGGQALTGSSATAAAVLAGLGSADIAHLAAHGAFRADNPLFSSLEFVDGALTVYDVELLERAPTMCVLSACESGLSDVRAGDELMGLVATLLALGTATIVASVTVVPDETTKTLMTAFHGFLAAGIEPADALARAQASADHDVGGSGVRGGFVCFGSG